MGGRNDRKRSRERRKEGIEDEKEVMMKRWKHGRKE